MKKLRKIMCCLLVFAMVVGEDMTTIPFRGSEQVLATENPTGPTSGTCGENITWELTEDTEANWDLVQGTPYKLTLTGSGRMQNFSTSSNIPWYEYSSMITSVSIAEGITTVGKYAFFRCVSLKNITLPDSVTAIEESAFYACYLLEEVIFGKGLKTIGNDVFYDNRSLTTIQFNDGLEIIETQAFTKCTALKDITLPDSVTDLGSRAFSDTGLTSFIIPKNIDVIRGGILSHNVLQSIQVAEGNSNFAVLDNILYEIRDNVPYRAITGANASLSSEVSIAEGTEIIDVSAFSYSKMTSVILPDTLKSILEDAFFCCPKLQEVNIPDNVERIDVNTFYLCSALSKVTIGKGLQAISSPNRIMSPFAYCTNLAVITVSEDNPYLDSVDNVIYNKDHTCLYFYAPAKPDEEYHIPNTVESLSCESIAYTSKLKVLYIPENITIIPTLAISCNSKLQDIYFTGNAPLLKGYECITHNADNLVIYHTPYSIGWDDEAWSSYTFANWNPQNTIQEEGVIGDIFWSYEGDIGRISFTGEGDLPDFTEESPAPWSSYIDSVQKIETEGISGIGNYAFSNAANLLRLETDAELKRIGDYAFLDCGSLLYFDIATVEIIGTGAFQNAVSIRDPLRLEKVFSIGSGAFQGCTTLTDATLGNCLGSLEKDVFAGCTALSGFMIPESVTDIKTGALKNCSSLRTINIPANVDAIGAEAFSGDIALEKVYFYGNIPKNWHEDSFTGCSEELILYYRKFQTDWLQLNGRWNGLNLVGLERFYTEKQDHYSFSNSASSFGYQADYRVPRQRYVDVLDSITKGTYFYSINKYWKGSCYGMASTTLEFYENQDDSRFQIKNYNNLAENLYDIAVPDAALTKLIEGYQISQYKYPISGCRGDIYKHMEDYRGLIQKVEEFERSGGLRGDDKAETVIMAIYSVFGGHVVIPVSVDQADNGDFLLKVYDPNYPSSLQTVKIYKDFSGISYGFYYYASYIDYTSAANAMSDIQLYDSAADSSIYLSIDKENGTVINAEGKMIDEIEGAYELKPFNSKEEDTFSGIRSYVLPEGNYQFKTKKEENTEEAEVLSADVAEDEEETVTFYLGSEEHCAEITSSDAEVVLEVQKTDKESGELEISLQSESDSEETSVFTIMNQQGMERIVEVESGSASVTITEENMIMVSAEERIFIDGVEAAVENGQAIIHFEAMEGENPFKVKELNVSVSCGADNTLNGEVNADVISNAVSAKDVTVKVDYLDKNEKCIASYSEEMMLYKGLNTMSVSFEELKTDFDETEGNVDLLCRLTVVDENKNSAISVIDGLSVTLMKQPEPSKEPEEDIELVQKQQALQEAVENAKKKDLSIYTEESVKIYRSALGNAEKVLRNQNATKENIEEALKNLQKSEKMLELRKEKKEKEQLNEKLPAKDSIFSVKGYRYKVIKSDVKNVQVSLIKAPSKKTVTVPASVKKNGFTFQVTAIEKNACSKNKKLTKVIIGKNIMYIGPKAFSKCQKLKTIIFKGKKVPKVGRQAFQGIKADSKIYISKKMDSKQLKRKMKLAGVEEKGIFVKTDNVFGNKEPGRKVD